VKKVRTLGIGVAQSSALLSMEAVSVRTIMTPDQTVHARSAWIAARRDRGRATPPGDLGWFVFAMVMGAVVVVPLTLPRLF
jgi:hypothetical protein